MSTLAHDDAHDSHAHGDPDAHLAHHFDTPQQQFDAGKLGIWLFLTTEILLFSGLFCAYAVYRANHPEVFEFAHKYLNKELGAINTVVLLFSSLTMAWAVRAAQLGQKNLLIGLLSLTLLCGCGFLGIKYEEYHHKFETGTLWGDKYAPTELPPQHAHESEEAIKEQEAALEALQKQELKNHTVTALTSTVATAPAGYHYDQSKYAQASVGPAGISADWAQAEVTEKPVVKKTGEWEGSPPDNAHLFFSIYFVMTGLHGLHVIAGMAAITWILMRSIKGEFGPKFFNPVDFVGLYWHIVDLIWIFLFPLLYLIN